MEEPNSPDGERGGTTKYRSRGVTTEIATAEIREGYKYTEDSTPVLSVVVGNQAGLVVPLNGKTFTLGRDAACDVPLVGSGISRNHCRIERRPDDTFVITDLNSTNGVFVGGRRKKSHVLAPGDLIKLGVETVLKYSMENRVDVKIRRRRFEQSIHDDLTGLFNRRYFDTRFKHELAYATRHGESLSVIVFDVDSFKTVNDEFGHASGDAVIKRLAHRLFGHLRSEDILARYGGEEFAIILRGHDEERAYTTAERVRAFVETLAFPLGDEHRSLTISLGISTLRPGGPATAEELVAEADANLYEAKSKGKNCTVGTRAP